MLTYQITQAPENGSLTGQNNVYLYVPSQDYNGTDTFKFIVFDLNWTSNEATVTISIDPVNDFPVVEDVVYSMNEDSSIEIQLNGYDIEDDNLTLSIEENPINGNLSFIGNDTYLYTPEANFFGTDAFSYSAFDGQLFSNIATIDLSLIHI